MTSARDLRILLGGMNNENSPYDDLKKQRLKISAIQVRAIVQPLPEFVPGESNEYQKARQNTINACEALEKIFIQPNSFNVSAARDIVVDQANAMIMALADMGVNTSTIETVALLVQRRRSGTHN